MLTERQRMILSAIIDDYVRSAEPIGSRSISKRAMSASVRRRFVTRCLISKKWVIWSSPIRPQVVYPRIKVIAIMSIILLQHGTLHNNDLNSMKGAFAEQIKRWKV